MHIQPQRIQQHGFAGRAPFDGLFATRLLLICGFHVGNGSLDETELLGGPAAGGELRGPRVAKGDDTFETVGTGGGSIIHSVNVSSVVYAP